MPWIRRMLRGNLVWVRADDSGRPVAGGDGRVDVIYKLAPDAKIYRAGARNLESSGDPEHDKPVATGGPGDPGSETSAAPAAQSAAAVPAVDPIIIYTDGACSKNPGPMGLGAVIVDREKRTELSEYLGIGTNQIAELTAIERALETIDPADRNRTVIVHSDSAYSIGLLTKPWKAKANVELVARLRALARQFSDLRFVKVKGHAGIPENERCDQLATGAIRTARR
jgi:ribonuclease HI